jgi:hypothetical protein
MATLHSFVVTGPRRQRNSVGMGKPLLEQLSEDGWRFCGWARHIPDVMYGAALAQEGGHV